MHLMYIAQHCWDKRSHFESPSSESPQEIGLKTLEYNWLLQVAGGKSRDLQLVPSAVLLCDSLVNKATHK
jgi:hypothetical protein